MNRSDVCATGIVAAVIAGGLAGVVYIGTLTAIDALASRSTALDPDSALVFVLVGGITGVLVGGVLGAAPVAVAVVAWPSLRAGLGEARAMDVTALAVAVLCFLEVFVLWLNFSGRHVGGAVALMLVIALVAGVGARIALGVTSRSAARRVAMLTGQD